MTGVILYRLKSESKPVGIPFSGVAYFEVIHDPEDQFWYIRINASDGTYFQLGRGSREYCENKFQILYESMSENRSIDITDW